MGSYCVRHSPLTVGTHGVLFFLSFFLCLFACSHPQEPIIFLQLWAWLVVQRVSEQRLDLWATLRLLRCFSTSNGFLFIPAEGVFRSRSLALKVHLVLLCIHGAGAGVMLHRNCVSGRGRGGRWREDACRLEDGEAEKGQEQVDGEGQAGQAQVDGASGSSQLQLSHSVGTQVANREK